MKSIKEFVENILSDNQITSLTGNNKVYFLHNSKPISPYITYEIIDESGEMWVEGKEIAVTYYVQVNIFSKTNDYSELENKIKEHMMRAGFERAMSADLYEKDTELYHKAMRFTITINNGGI